MLTQNDTRQQRTTQDNASYRKTTQGKKSQHTMCKTSKTNAKVKTTRKGKTGWKGDERDLVENVIVKIDPRPAEFDKKPPLHLRIVLARVQDPIQILFEAGFGSQ